MLLVLCAFLCEYTDSTLGMGYGTTLTPLLMIMGFEPLQIVPVVLVSELVTGIMAGVAHHREGNIDFGDLANQRLAIIFGLCGVIGSVLAVLAAFKLPAFWLKFYIGSLVTLLGIFMFVKLIGKLKKKEVAAPAPVVRTCSFCLEPVADNATRCPHCTSDIAGK